MDGNFCLFVAKRWKAILHPLVDTHNMVTGKVLATGRAGLKSAPSANGNHLRAAGRGVALPVRMIAKLRSAVKSRVPFGYEDAAGFHYGAEAVE